MVKSSSAEEKILKGIDTINIYQKNQLIKDLNVNVQNLASSFTSLNNEMQKSNTFFEQMNKSSIAVERLTVALVIFTILLTCLTLTPLVKDILDIELIWALVISFCLPTLLFGAIFLAYKK